MRKKLGEAIDRIAEMTAMGSPSMHEIESIFDEAFPALCDDCKITISKRQLKEWRGPEWNAPWWSVPRFCDGCFEKGDAK